MVTLYAPDGVNSCSFDGVEYVVDKGKVEVPEEAVANLVEHGFSGAPLVADKPSKK